MNEENDRVAAAMTHADASRWVSMAVDESINRRCNVVFDGTLGNPDSSLKRLRQFLDAGYEVEVRALAVGELTSWLSVLFRYEQLRARDGAGRMTPKEVHDEAYEGHELTLPRIQEVEPGGVRITAESSRGTTMALQPTRH